jgi:hypothetical protein
MRWNVCRVVHAISVSVDLELIGFRPVGNVLPLTCRWDYIELRMRLLSGWGIP